MHRLRQARFLARFVLVWFALSIGAAIASPLVNPKAMQLVCSGSGAMKLLLQSDDGSAQPSSSHTLDCPLCAATGSPPPDVRLAVEPPQELAHALRPAVAATIASLTRAPLPARGPPSRS